MMVRMCDECRTIINDEPERLVKFSAPGGITEVLDLCKKCFVAVHAAVGAVLNVVR